MEEIISLNGNRKLQNAIKKAGLETFNPQGEWNGYGYKKLPLAVKLKNKEEKKIFNKILKELELAPKKEPLAEEEKIEKWAKRLSKLTNISLDDAKKIAYEKLEYKENEIRKLEDRQNERYSMKREKLINEIKRTNPLRRIDGEEHAQAILSASKRHRTTRYENYLEEFREEAKLGNINYEDVKYLARERANEELERNSKWKAKIEEKKNEQEQSKGWGARASQKSGLGHGE